MLGLAAPQQAVLQIVNATAPRETSTDRIEAALADLTARDPKEEPTTH